MSSITVLGKWPDYINLAHKLGARHFDVGSDAFKAMGAQVAWQANAHFLDSMRHAGDTFVLSVDPRSVRTGTLLRELQHLSANQVQIPQITVWTT